VYNSSLIPNQPGRDDVDVLAVPATQIATELGSTLLTNMVLLGAYLEHSRLLAPEAVDRALETLVAQDERRNADRKALRAGAVWRREHAVPAEPERNDT